ncbi:MAG: DUF559 domain-containing protein [Candidatus Marinimicrobia bacterium]|nr:DUF559 domain-containing protein [Candidatus Neomarinimicrobiota bacterium]
MKIICTECGIESEKPDKEIKSQMKSGRTKFFCSMSCAGYYNNRKRFPPKPFIKIKCKNCNNEFETKNYAKQFCSRSCASSGSITEKRINAGKSSLNNFANLSQEDMISMISKGLKSREKWKYLDIESLLKRNNIRFEFEFPLDNYVYDLALFDKKLLIEFDGSYHHYEDQKEVDDDKNETAIRNGWIIKRIKVNEKIVFDKSLIEPIILKG